MRIKKLELFGFKSFKDRTVINFDAGITGIVGPNGCGKSNIVDALVWVMGEMSAKHLRGSSMSDVIFSGAEGYAPMGMAEVNLTLENDGGPFPAKYMKHSEVQVTRRLHRSGDSEYLINKEPARLRDIQEIFMDTGAGSKGFSIIEQGAIGKIITAKPEERRTLIEEAAGITKFKVRKRESQRKLVQTDQNLVRLQDIIGEQKRQLDSLQRQAQRAERYKKLKDEAEEKDLWLSSKKFLDINVETVEAQKVFQECQEFELNFSGELNEIEADLEERKTAVAEKETQVQDSLNKHQEFQKLIVQKEKEIRELEFEIEQARRNKEMTGSIAEKYQVRKQALENEYELTDFKLTEVRELAEDLALKYETKNAEYQKINERIQQADDDLTHKRREMLAVSQSESHMEAKLSSLESNILEKETKLAEDENVREELLSKKQEFEERRIRLYKDLEGERQLRLEITRDLDLLNENRNLLLKQVEEKKSDVEALKDQLNEVASRLYGLEDLHSSFEGFQEGVKNVMLWQRERQEQLRADGSVEVLFQPVSEIIEVPAEYEMVMEAALGTRLQLLLSPNADNTLSAVNYLKDHNSGRSSFLSEDAVVNTHSSDEQIKKESGVRGLLSEVISVPEKFKTSINQIVNQVVVVETLSAALGLRPTYSDYTFVTLEGDTLTPDGVLTGGASESVESGVLKRRREIKELSLKREELAGKLSLSQLSLEKLTKQLKSLEEQLEEAKKLSIDKERAIVVLEKDYERAENELHNAETALKRQQESVDRQVQLISDLKEQLLELRESIFEIKEKKAGLDKAVESLTEELLLKKSGIDQMQEEVAQLRVESSSKRQELENLNQQIDRLQNSLDEVNEQLQQMTNETQKSSESLTENQVLLEHGRVHLEKMISESKEAEAQLSSLKDEYELQATDVRQLEQQVSHRLHARNQYQLKLNESQLKLEQLRMKEQYLIDQVNERYMKDLRLVAPEYKDTEGDVEQTEKDIEELRSKLKKIGEVNLSAIEEYSELIGRYEFLKQQHEDLISAKDQLRKVIDRINRICSRRFKDTFEQVNERFMKVFPVLFGGGFAKLILVEDSEKGEMGIDIVAQPPGKKPANVSLLSGGEKALTAVSLIFSIFLVKPSPFCLLDEVDAPLDDANVHRFNDLVKEMAKRSQIIVVTHNKHTMKVNKKLFGVTQEEKGVSKMVSVSLAEAQKVVD